MEKRDINTLLKKNRYLIACICIIAIMLVGFMILGSTFHNVFKEELTKSSHIMATLVAEDIEAILLDTEHTVDYIANSKGVKNFFAVESSKSLEAINEELDLFSKKGNSVCYLMNLEGLTLASSNRDSPKSFVGKNYAFRPYFKQALKSNKASYFALGVTSGKRGYYASAPIKDITGKIIGVAVVKKELDEHEEHIKKFKEFLFANKDGIVFLSSNPKYLFRSIYPLSEKQQKQIKASKQFGRGPFRALFNEWPKEGYEVKLDLKKMLVTERSVGNYGWKVIFLQPISEIAFHDLLILLPFFGLSLLVMVFFYYMYQKDRLLQVLRRSEQRYTSIFEAGPQPTLIFDLNANIIACSHRIEDILGYAPEEVVGQSGFAFGLTEDKARSIVGEVKRKGEARDVTFTMDHKNGNKRNLNLNATLMPGRYDGEQASIVCVLEDVTDRLATVANLRDAELKQQKVAQEYKLARGATLNILEDLQDTKDAVEADRRGFLNIIESSWDGIVIVDDNGIVWFLNKSAQRICYGDDRDVIGKPFEYIITAGQVDTIKITQQSGKSIFVESRGIKIDWMQQSMNLIVLHDITEQQESKNLLLHAAEEWRRTFDAIGDGVSLLNTKGQVIRCNRAAAKIFNKPFPDVIGINCQHFFHGEVKDPDCVIDRTIASKTRSTRAFNKDENWYLISADPLVNDGVVTGIVHTISDITEQKKNENKLKEYAEYIENIVETAQAVIVVLDKKFKIKSINHFAQELLGYKSGDVVGSNWVDLVVPEKYRDEISQVFLNCLEGDRIKEYEIPILAKNGKESMISWYSSELRTGDGKIVGIVTMGYDVSNRKEMEKVQRLAQLGTLVSHMAHEVNNPLMVISGRAQLSLMEDIQNQEVKDNLNVVLKECKRAKDIIQRLLRFSRPSKGEINIVDIKKSLEEVVDLLEHQFKLENVTISTNFASDSLLVRGDEKQLHEVFMNLLTNAQDAIEGEGMIKTQVKEKKDFIEITFIDSGAGISQKVLEKIFDPFFTTKKKGTGLGLAICHSIIKTHNGELKFKSVEGKGTTVTILLPVFKEK